ncbi:outer membrane beta-barrel protein [Devosia sp.]|uniref:outer membrane protein n=1 Tax=Devosia sp. TaxID=1871048 RepID=UPI0032636DF2
MFRILALAVTSLFSIGSANAADLIIGDPSAPVVLTAAGFDWTGFYAGINGGYTSGQAASVGVVTFVTTNVPITGGMLGVNAGYNAQFSNFVLGVEGDVAWSGASGSAVCTANAAYTCQGALNWLGTIKGRAGIVVDSLLFFGTAGLAVGGATASLNPVAPGLTSTYSGTMTGWTVGGGVEVAVTEAISVKAEYSYFSMGGLQAPVGTLSGVQASDLSSINHVVKVGVNFHF